MADNKINDKTQPRYIDYRPDGVYLVIKDNDPNDKEGKRAVFALLDKLKSIDVKLTDVSEALNSSEPLIELKLADMTPDMLKEKVTFKVTDDKMQAFAIFEAPAADGAEMYLTAEEIKSEMMVSGIVFGINEEQLKEIAGKEKLNVDYLVASGVEAVEGMNGRLDWHFNPVAETGPTILEDDKVDYKSIHKIQLVSKDDLLVEITRETEGTPGTDVLGRTVSAKNGKPAPPLPVGKNTVAGPDGLTLYAEVSGEVAIVSKKVTVNPIKTVEGDVDFSTGDIFFNGAVNVKGNVLTGFTIVADGNVDVNGLVEGATIKSNGEIFVAGGIQGNDKAYIQAKGGITAKFIERATVETDGKVLSGSILHSNVKSGDSIELSGKHARLAGGSCTARNSIHAKTIGANQMTHTTVEVGNNPGVLEDFNALKEEFMRMKVEYDKQGQIVKLLKDQYEKNEITEERKQLLMRTIHARKANKEKMTEIQKKIEEMMYVLESSRGMIKASNYVRSGVTVIIGNAQMKVRDDIPCCTLINEAATVVVRSY
jgi:hypothetical protein